MLMIGYSVMSVIRVIASLLCDLNKLKNSSSTMVPEVSKQLNITYSIQKQMKKHT